MCTTQDAQEGNLFWGKVFMNYMDSHFCIGLPHKGTYGAPVHFATINIRMYQMNIRGWGGLELYWLSITFTTIGNVGQGFGATYRLPLPLLTTGY